MSRYCLQVVRSMSDRWQQRKSSRGDCFIQRSEKQRNPISRPTPQTPSNSPPFQWIHSTRWQWNGIYYAPHPQTITAMCRAVHKCAAAEKGRIITASHNEHTCSISQRYVVRWIISAGGFSATVAGKVQVNFFAGGRLGVAFVVCLFIGGIRHENQVLWQYFRNYKYSQRKYL